MNEIRRWFQSWGGPGSGNFGHKGMPGQKGGSAPGILSEMSDKAYTSIKTNGGVTIGIGGDVPTKGYAFSPYKGMETKIGEDVFTKKTIMTFIKSAVKPRHFSGSGYKAQFIE